jgi:putative spermidine/putrescine transport system permease protein
MTVQAMTAPDVVDGAELKRRLRRAESRQSTWALVLVAPLALFIILTFVAPIAYLLRNAVYDPDVADNLPRTVAALQQWDGKDVPGEEAFAALVADAQAITESNTPALVGKRLNYEISGIRSKVVATIKKAILQTAPPYKDKMLAESPILMDRLTWAKIKQAGQAYNSFYFLSMVDLERDADGNIKQVVGERSVYKMILGRTLYISVLVTLLTLVLGFPIAYLLANLPARTANLLMIFVLLPFWTSLLVRTTAWFVLLQDNGPINDTLIGLQLTSEPLKLIFSRFGTIIAMTHIQLPFTLLPIYSVMKGISPSYMRAARSLGGGPIYSFIRVYLPLTLPGIGAGCLLTFILSLGYYITPALVGGPADQMVSGIIAQAMNQEGNWGKACALGAILLVATLLFYWVYDRLVGIDKVKLG